MCKTGVAVAIASTLLSSAIAGDEVSRILPRSYGVRRVALDFPAKPLVSLSYSKPNLWSATQRDLWRFDGAGRSHPSELSLQQGPRIKRIWAEGTAATVWAGDQLITVDLSGKVTRTRKTEMHFREVVPTMGGYVGHVARDASLWYIRDAGEALRLPAPVNPAVAGETAGDDQETAVPGAKPFDEVPLAEDGVLGELDEAHVAYVSLEPYRVWVMGLDGSMRTFAVDESRVTRVEESATITRHPERQYRGPNTQSGLSRVMSVIGDDGKVVVVRRNFANFVLTRAAAGKDAGFEFSDQIILIDFIDAERGEVVERVDKAGIGVTGGFAGLRDGDLVFAGSTYAGEPFLSIASAD